MFRNFNMALMAVCALINLALLIVNVLHANPMSFVNALGLFACVYIIVGYLND